MINLARTHRDFLISPDRAFGNGPNVNHLTWIAKYLTLKGCLSNPVFDINRVNRTQQALHNRTKTRRSNDCQVVGAAQVPGPHDHVAKIAYVVEVKVSEKDGIQLSELNVGLPQTQGRPAPSVYQEGLVAGLKHC